MVWGDCFGSFILVFMFFGPDLHAIHRMYGLKIDQETLGGGVVWDLRKWTARQRSKITVFFSAHSGSFYLGSTSLSSDLKVTEFILFSIETFLHSNSNEHGFLFPIHSASVFRRQVAVWPVPPKIHFKAGRWRNAWANHLTFNSFSPGHPQCLTRYAADPS